MKVLVRRRSGVTPAVLLPLLMVAATAAGVLALPAPLATQEQPQQPEAVEPEVLVRIAARPVAGGSVELGLQVLGAGEQWGRRRLPENRFLPARATPGEWLASSALRVDADAAVGGGPARENAVPLVRIVARRLADGRVEFGLQTQAGNARWTPRLLPGRRFAPRGAALDVWLVSGPVRLAGDATAMVRLAEYQEQSAAAVITDAVLEWANELRAARAGPVPLVAHPDLSAAAAARAAAMAEASDWLEGYDYGADLAGAWDNWVTARSAYTTAGTDDRSAMGGLAESLTADEAGDILACNLCSHMGVGLARRHGRTYATVLLAGEAPSEHRVAAVESDMARLVNELRAEQGLSALEYHEGLAEVARSWSATMGATGDFRHNPDSDKQAPAGWTSLAENISSVWPPVSLSRSVRTSFDQLVESPGHYRNMTAAHLTHIGVGIALDDAALWVTQLFATYP